MKPARILLLAVAIMAGGLAAFLATRGEAPAPEPTRTVTEVRQEPKQQVLVAAKAIGVGQRLNAGFVEWQDWPEGAVRPEYITSEVMPDAMSQIAGTVARFEIFPGEPVRRAKLVRSDQGYLSAVINKGMRAVSIPVSAESGAGGFIVPNDRVDVVQTSRGGNGSATRTILSNVKVLAIGQRLGEIGPTAGQTDGEEETDPRSQMFVDETIATLELDPGQAEAIVNAANSGRLTLVLRSVSDFSPETETNTRSTQAIRLIKFGAQSDIMTGVGQTAMNAGGAESEPEIADPFTLPQSQSPQQPTRATAPGTGAGPGLEPPVQSDLQ